MTPEASTLEFVTDEPEDETPEGAYEANVQEALSLQGQIEALDAKHQEAVELLKVRLTAVRDAILPVIQAKIKPGKKSTSDLVAGTIQVAIKCTDGSEGIDHDALESSRCKAEFYTKKPDRSVKKAKALLDAGTITQGQYDRIVVTNPPPPPTLTIKRLGV